MGSAYHCIRIWTHMKFYIPHINTHTNFKDAEQKCIETIQPILHDYNPLLNLLIFNKVLDYLDIASTLRLRGVCSSWNDEICRRLDALKSRPTYLKFQQDSDLLGLMKISSAKDPSVPFFLDNFYFKFPCFSPVLGQTLTCPFIQDLITSLKVAVYSSDFPILLHHLKSLRRLKQLYLIRLPDLSLELGRDSDIDPHYLNGTHALENLENLKLRNLTCGKSSFLSMSTHHTFTCTANLVSFLKCTPNLKILDMSSWPGKVITIIERCRGIHGSLEVLRIKGKTLGDDDLKRLTTLQFPALSRIELILDKNVTEEVITAFLSSLQKKNAVVELKS